MNNARKTKTELLKEIADLRMQISLLEKRGKVEHEERLKLAIMDRAPISIWACNRDFKIVFWSAGTDSVYGHSRKDAIGKNYLDLFVSDEERERSASDCLRVIDEDYIQKNFLAYDRLPDGNRRALLTNCFRVFDTDSQEYLQAEVALEVAELEPIIEEHRTLRELGIRKKAKEERALLLERLNRITEIISSSVLEYEGLDQVFEGISQIVEEITCNKFTSCIYLYDKRKDSWLPTSHIPFTQIFEPIKNILGQHLISNEDGFFIENENDIPITSSGLETWWKENDQRSIAGLPLRSSDEFVGIWLIAFQEPVAFQEEIRNALQLIANQSAFVISIGRLIENLKDLNAKIAEKQDLITRSLIAVDFVHRMNNLAGPIRGWLGLNYRGIRYVNKARRKNS